VAMSIHTAVLRVCSLGHYGLFRKFRSLMKRFTPCRSSVVRAPASLIQKGPISNFGRNVKCSTCVSWFSVKRQASDFFSHPTIIHNLLTCCTLYRCTADALSLKITKQQMFPKFLFTECYCVAVSNSTSYSEGPWFEYWPGHSISLELCDFCPSLWVKPGIMDLKNQESLPAAIF
jgi:hypothetical protein